MSPPSASTPGGAPAAIAAAGAAAARGGPAGPTGGRAPSCTTRSSDTTDRTSGSCGAGRDPGGTPRTRGPAARRTPLRSWSAATRTRTLGRRTTGYSGRPSSRLRRPAASTGRPGGGRRGPDGRSRVGSGRGGSACGRPAASPTAPAVPGRAGWCGSPGGVRPRSVGPEDAERVVEERPSARAGEDDRHEAMRGLASRYCHALSGRSHASPPCAKVPAAAGSASRATSLEYLDGRACGVRVTRAFASRVRSIPQPDARQSVLPAGVASWWLTICIRVDRRF